MIPKNTLSLLEYSTSSCVFLLLNQEKVNCCLAAANQANGAIKEQKRLIQRLQTSETFCSLQIANAGRNLLT